MTKQEVKNKVKGCVCYHLSNLSGMSLDEVMKSSPGLGHNGEYTYQLHDIIEHTLFADVIAHTILINTDIEIEKEIKEWERTNETPDDYYWDVTSVMASDNYIVSFAFLLPSSPPKDLLLIYKQAINDEVKKCVRSF